MTPPELTHRNWYSGSVYDHGQRDEYPEDSAERADLERESDERFRDFPIKDTSDEGWRTPE